MSIQFPQKRQVSDRKYHEAGVRGRFENNLRVLRGVINTTTPTILAGSGFSVVRNSAGTVTITFDPPFSAAPTVKAIVDRSIGGGNAMVVFITTGGLDTSTVQLRRCYPADFTGGVTLEDGGVHFEVTGPA